MTIQRRNSTLAEAAERMKMMRERRQSRGLREPHLVVPDARSAAVRRQIVEQIARLDPEDAEEAMAWIEAVSKFDNDASG